MDTDQSNQYLDSFAQCVKNEFPKANFKLLITGDIADSGDKTEYEYALKFINKILTDLHIDIADLLILPGDHDVHRLSLNTFLNDTPTKDVHLLNDVKFKNFSDFYEKLTKKTFAFGNAIVDTLKLNENIIIVGANSNFKINENGGLGAIDIEKFSDELERLKLGKSSDLKLIPCWHHNITSGFEDSNTGQWEKPNRQALIGHLELQKIKLILTGNEHTSNTRNINEIIDTSDCGIFSSLRHQNSFKAYLVHSKNEIYLENRIYSLLRTNDNNKPYYWTNSKCTDAGQKEKFLLSDSKTEILPDVEDIIPIGSTSDQSEEPPKEMVQLDLTKRNYYKSSPLSEEIYQVIKTEKLFHSGHFHWSETSRAHNWIDVSKLLEKNKNLLTAQKAIIDVIETFGLHHDCDLIIGLGYEGNILSTKPAIKYNIDHTYFAYSYREKKIIRFEDVFNHENHEKKYKKILIVTDVVNDGRTIRKFAHEHMEEFFKNTEQISVVSLFYTGDRKIDSNILNYDKIEKPEDKNKDYKINNIEFYAVKHIKVEKCPYGSDYRTECLIFRDDLNCVHMFYETVTD
ncbi:metallophosphoesterase family protein [Pedobacter sp.]